MTIRTAACVFWLLTAAVAVAASSNPEILTELERDRIYLGESVLYRVTLNHVEAPSAPQLEGFDDFEITSQGQRSLNSRQITIINGRRREMVRYGRAYDYLLTPQRAGVLTVPAPRAQVDGQSLQGKPLTLRVVAPEDQDVAILAVTVDRDSVYPMQPFTITLNVAVKQLPAPVADRSPLEVQPEPPALTIPWAEDDKLAAGLEPIIPWRQWLSALQDPRDHGFSINDIARNAAFSLFDRRPATFLPEPRQTRRKDRQEEDTGYWEYAFARQFRAAQVGPIRFGSVTLKGTFATGMGADRRLDGQPIFAVAEPVTVTVKDVPTAGQPDSYIGAIGRFEVTGDLNPRQAKIGDPMTLTVTVRGTGTLDRATPPDLGQIGALRDHFKIYEATSETTADSKRFTYALRPQRAGIGVLPRIPISYFDVESERYVTLQTEPISIEVAEAERLSGADITMTPSTPGANQTVEARSEGIFANITDPFAVVDESIRPRRWFAGFAALAASFGMVVLVTRQVQRLSGNRELARRRAAAPRAQHRLRAARQHISQGHLHQATDDVRLALIGWVADIACVPEAGLTSGDARQQLAALAVGQELLGRLAELLETCDAVRYGASESAVLGLEEEAAALLSDLIKALRKRRP